MSGRFHGWAVAWAAFVVAMFAWGMGFYGPGVYLQALHTLHGWSIAAISAAITIHYLSSAVIVTFLPDLHRRLGLAGTVAFGAIATAAGVFAWASVTAPWQLYAAALVSGAGWAVTSGATINAIVARWFDRDRPRAINLAFNGASVGGLLFPPLWVVLIGGIGFQSAAAILCGMTLIVLIPTGLRYFRNSPSDLGLAPDGAAAKGPAQATAPARTRRSLLPDPRFLSLSIPFAFALFAQVGLLSHMIARLAPVTGAALAAGCLSLITFAAMTGRTLLGRLVGEHDRRVVAAVNFAVQAAGVTLLVAGDHPAVLLAGCVVYGLGVGNLISLPPLIAQKEFPAADAGLVVALVTAINQAVFATAPAIFGSLRDATGAYTIPFLLAAGAQLLAAGLIVYGRRFRK